MRSFTSSAIVRKAQAEIDKQLEEKRLEIAYNALTANAPSIARSTEALVLYALSLNGYGKKRIQQIHEWVCGMSEIGEMMGKEVTFNGVKAHMAEKYGIDFEELTLRMPTWEEFRDET